MTRNNIVKQKNNSKDISNFNINSSLHKKIYSIKYFLTYYSILMLINIRIPHDRFEETYQLV